MSIWAPSTNAPTYFTYLISSLSLLLLLSISERCKAHHSYRLLKPVVGSRVDDDVRQCHTSGRTMSGGTYVHWVYAHTRGLCLFSVQPCTVTTRWTMMRKFAWFSGLTRLMPCHSQWNTSLLSTIQLWQCLMMGNWNIRSLKLSFREERKSTAGRPVSA